MKHFKDLTKDQQEKILDRTDNGPLFAQFRENTRQFLLNNTSYYWDDKLIQHVFIKDEHKQ